MPTSLRTATIRLAYSRSDMREHLLPLLVTARKKHPDYAAYVKKKKHQGKEPLSEEAWKSKVLGPGAEPKGDLRPKGKPDEKPGKPESDKKPEAPDVVVSKPKDEPKPEPKDEKKDAPPKAKGKIQEAFEGFMSKLMAKAKDVPKKIKEALDSAGDEIKAFISDPEHRKKTMDKTAEAIKGSPKKVAKNVHEAAKEFVEEHKRAGRGVVKLVTGEKLDHHEKHALFHCGVMAASVAVGAMSGGTTGAALALGKTFTRYVASKAAHEVLTNVNVLAEAGEIAHTLGEGAMAILEGMSHVASTTPRKVAGEDVSEDDALSTFANAIVAMTIRTMEKGLSEDEVVELLQGKSPKGTGKYGKSYKEPEPEGSPKEGSDLRRATIRLAASHLALRPLLLQILANDRNAKKKAEPEDDAGDDDDEEPENDDDNLDEDDEGTGEDPGADVEEDEDADLDIDADENADADASDDTEDADASDTDDEVDDAGDTGSSDFQIDPEAIFTCLVQIAQDPEKWGVSEDDQESLTTLSDLLKPLSDKGDKEDKEEEPDDEKTQGSEDRGYGANEPVKYLENVGKGDGHAKEASISSALDMASTGVKLLQGLVRLSKKLADKAHIGKKYEHVVEKTLGIAYSMVCLGTAATLCHIAPDHPIAQHAQEFDHAVEQAAPDLSTVKKLLDKTTYIVGNTNDDDVDKSLQWMGTTVKKVRGTSEAVHIPTEVLQSSLKMHHALQDLYGAFRSEPGGEAKSEHEPEGPGAGTYDDYIKWKKTEGGRPMAKDDWEARYKKKGSLRAQVIRLAHENERLRPDLLPLLD